MKHWLALLAWVALGVAGIPGKAAEAGAGTQPVVYVVPVRDDIMPPMVYLVRRGVKEAMEAKADLLVLDMETNGGRVDVTEEIINILNRFPGRTATYVNTKSFSAGAFISAATQKIFMAPQSVIGAAAPVMMLPGSGPQEMPETVQAKMNSAIRALVRTSAEKNGHNVEVMEAMIDPSKELKIDGKVLNEKGQILTLTNIEAEREYGDPAKPLLSAGTVESVAALAGRMGLEGARLVVVRPTGAEQVAFWINAISPLLLLVGIVGVYVEFKTPGFGLPGIVGIVAFGLYFLGGYIAGLSGMEWVAVFVLGLVLVALELFVFPGTVLLGLGGGVLVLISLVMAWVDIYPGMPQVPTFQNVQAPLVDLLIAFAGAAVVGYFLSRWLPKTPLYGQLVSQAASGVHSVAEAESVRSKQVGWVGVAMSPLRPGGKGRFGEEVLDVITEGEMIDKGRSIRIIGHSATEAVVEPAD